MTEQHDALPISIKEYCIDDKKYMVISHYTGKKDIDKVINEIAIKKAYLDIGKTIA